jgi:putative transposase
VRRPLLAHQRGIALRLIEPGKPNQNAYIESFNGRFCDECLNEHWFTSLAHAQVRTRAADDFKFGEGVLFDL